MFIITILVSAYRRSKDLEHGLKALQQQICPAAEVLVVRIFILWIVVLKKLYEYLFPLTLVLSWLKVLLQLPRFKRFCLL